MSMCVYTRALTQRENRKSQEDLQEIIAVVVSFLCLIAKDNSFVILFSCLQFYKSISFSKEKK